MRIFVIVVLACALCGRGASGDELHEKFLDALRERQYYDVALEYLDEMEASPLASDSFKRVIPFERAQTLIQSTTRLRDAAEINNLLEQAEELLSKSELAAVDEQSKARSQSERGDLLFRRAKIFLSLAEKPRLTAAEKETQFVEARKFLDKALEAFAQARASYKKLVDEYQLDVRDPESRPRLKRLKGIYTVVRVKFPQILELYADTLSPADPKRQKYLTEAVADYEQMWLRYPKFPAGLDSCYYAARCHNKLKQPDKAIQFLQRLFNLPDQPSLANLKKKSLALAADCWAATEPYPFDEVIANFERFVDKLSRRESRQSEWQRVQLELARAYFVKAGDLKKINPSDGRAKRLSTEATKLVRDVARFSIDHRGAARQLMDQWDLKLGALDEADENESAPTTFAQAKQRGVDMISQIEGINADIADAELRLRDPGFSDARKIETDINSMKEKLSGRCRQCISVLERAVALRDATTSREDLNQIRYLQSVCYFILKDYFESALIGEFLATRYPTIAYSRQAGGIAIRSYSLLYQQANDSDRVFEQERLMQLSRHILEQWPGSVESNQAAGMVARLTLAKPDLSDDDIATVEELIEAVGKASSEGAALSVKLGTEMWFAYLREKKQDSVTEASLNESLNRTIKYLETGLAGFNVTNLNMDAAWAAVFSVNAHLDDGDLDSALKQLEQSEISPIDLVKEKNRVVLSSGKSDLYRSETFKIAGRTYLAALSKYPADGQWSDKALGVVRAMQALARDGKNDRAKRDVLNMYRLIAAELQQQWASIDDANERRSRVGNLVPFLRALQAEADDVNTIIRCGRTLMNMADSFTADGNDSDAKLLYRAAAKALQRAATMGVADEKLVNEIARQQAVAQSGVGDYEIAYNQLLDLLKQKPNAWQIQIDIAMTLQKWGTRKQDKALLVKALSGGERFVDSKSKRPKNLIWGWSKLAEAFKSNPKYKEPYFQSVYGAVATRFEYGKIDENPKVVAAALKRYRLAKSKDSKLGGTTWRAKFDALEKEIENQMKALQVSADKRN